MADALDQPVAAAHGPIGRSIEWACAAMAVLAGVAFCIESVMSVVSVVGRATLGKPVPGDYEIVQMLSAMGIAMCLPYCQIKKGHVFVDFFTLWAPDRLKIALDALASLLMAGAAFLLAWRIWHGMLEMRDYGEMTMVISLPVWWGYVPVVPSFMLLGIAALYTFTQELRGEVKP